MRRVTSAVSLAFHVERARESHRTLATRDGLTGLWNRQAFFAQLEASRPHRHVAVLCADLDDFRTVNEGPGYAAGDDLLVEVANRFSQAVRPGDTLARVSADEFAVLCSDVPTEGAVAAIAERVLGICDQSFMIAGTPTDFTLSVGLPWQHRTVSASRSSTRRSGSCSTLSTNRGVVGDWTEGSGNAPELTASRKYASDHG